jgi:hypothetical protein
MFDTLQNIAESDPGQRSVHITLDEMKCQLGFYFRSRNNSLIEFASANSGKDLAIAANIEAFVSNNSVDDENENKSLYEPAKYVNVFCIRNTTSKTHNGEFFFNNGSLTRDDMVGQLVNVILCCELSNLHVFGVCMDAGGRNASMYLSLTGNPVLKGASPPLRHFCFENPVDNTVFIYIFFCSVHNLKEAGNNLLRSQHRGTRGFCRDGVYFGWNEVVQVYKRIEASRRADSTARILPRLTQTVTQPDKFSLMSVHDAKVPFDTDSLNYQCTYIAFKFGCIEEMKDIKEGP